MPAGKTQFGTLVSAGAALYAAGGLGPSTKHYNNIYKLTCGGDVTSCMWETSATVLPNRRYAHIPMAVTDEIAATLCGSQGA